jgi:hypothetical protein
VSRLEQSSNLHINSLPVFWMRRESVTTPFIGKVDARQTMDSPTYAHPCSEHKAVAIFNTARSGKPVPNDEQAQWAAFLLVFFGRLDAEKVGPSSCIWARFAPLIHARRVNWDPTGVSIAWAIGRKRRRSVPI